MRAAYVFGPAARTGVLRPFRLPNVTLEPLTDAHSATPPDALLVFAGDGTVHHQLGFLVKTRTPLLVVPCGSGNDFAHSIGIHTRKDAVRLWQSFCIGATEVRELDVGAISPLAEGIALPPGGEETLFCNICGAGLDSAANRAANNMTAFSLAHGGYSLAAFFQLLLFPAEKFKVSTRDSHGQWVGWLQERALMVAVGNSPHYGGGIRITPKARLDDGKLDVCFIREASRRRRFQLLPVARRGLHLTLPEVEYMQTQQLRIETETRLEVYADGEFAGNTPVEIRVRPRALRVIAPPA